MKMKDHSVFVAFAPRVNPKIAIAVIVENAGYGATWAGPVASLMIEKYLLDSVSAKRKPLEQKLYNANLVNKYIFAIDSAQRLRDQARMERRTRLRLAEDSAGRVQDTIRAKRFLHRYYTNKNRE
jgi:penicillin-binding protein 2